MTWWWQVGDKPVRNMAELLAAVAALAPDSRVAVQVQRGARLVDVSVRIGQRPSAGRRAP